MKYVTYWQLEKAPFEKDIAPEKLLRTADFAQAMGSLRFLFECGGVGLLTGKPGYGKTTILRSFIAELPPGLYKSIYLQLSTVKCAEFYRMLAAAMGLEPARTKSENFTNIQKRIVSLKTNEKVTPVLILDEAQYLHKDILIELPMLMNFEMDRKDYAVLILSGYPSLNIRLSMETYEALKDRIIASYDINGMTLEEVQNYISTRLRDAGVKRELFIPQAAAAAQAAAKNSIRRLNLILTKAMMIACSREIKIIDAQCIQMAVEEIRLEGI
ncbi:MAG: AAA family ATPase [Clostridia bacterium]|nr:AAA family ATPase [Clostridia bacterium]